MDLAHEGPPTCIWSGPAWRYTLTRHQPLDATGAVMYGGRWNPAGTFAALYLGTPRTTVLDDLAAAVRVLALEPDDLPDFALHEVRVTTLRLLDLRTLAARRTAGLAEQDLAAEDRAACQRVAQDAWNDGLQGVVAPAATGSGLVLAVFSERAPAGSLVVEQTEPLALRSWVAPSPAATAVTSAVVPPSR